MPQPAGPRERDLEEGGRILAERGDNVSVVRLFEAWSAQGSPTVTMRLRAARAFFALRLMDRSLARLREVLEAEPGNLEAVRLQAEVYVERGWPQRARPNLAHLREAGVEVPELEARAAAEPVRPESNARAIEREGDPRKMLALAEQFLATGSFVRGRGLLERLRRQDGYDARVNELLWGLSGESGEGDRPLAELLRELVPLAPLRIPDRGEEPEHTESVSAEGLGALADAALPAPIDQVAFPTLFKHGFKPGAEEDEGGENTVASRLFPPDPPAPGGPGEGTDAGMSAAPAGGGDTQILLVIRPGENASLRAHRRRDAAEDGLRDSLDLRRYQASMGMSAAPSSAEEPLAIEPEEPADDLLEDEDEHLVVLTRSEGSQADREPSHFDRPIEVVEKPIVPLATPASEADRPTPWLPPAPPPPTSGARNWVVVAFAAVAGLVLVLAAAVAMQAGLPAAVEAPSAREVLVTVLARADYDALLAEEIRLEGLPEDAESRLALAEARLVLWWGYNGDPARLGAVRQVAEEAVAADPHRRDYLRGALALARGEMNAARKLLEGSEPADDADRVMLARLHAATGDSPRALAALDGAASPDAPWLVLERARVLAESGRTGEAQAAVAELRAREPDHVLARTTAVLLPGSERTSALAAVDAALREIGPRRLPPRVEADLHARRAVLLAEAHQGDAAIGAVDAGLARDGTHPTLLFLRAAHQAAVGHNLDALATVERVVEARPGAIDSQRARVLLLLDLDRVDRAEAAVKAARATGVAVDEVEVLDALVRVIGRQQPPVAALSPLRLERPVGAWADALWAAQAQRSDAVEAARAAVARLAASDDPFVRRLLPRARAHEAMLSGGADAVRRALDQGAADPLVHVVLARAYESAGNLASASLHFDRAAELGSEFALPQYERARFYQDSSLPGAGARAGWGAYLAFAPEGPRAERVRALPPEPPG